MRSVAKGHVLELGVRGGASTSAFLAAAEDGRVERLWSVDINACGGIWAYGHENWTFVQGESSDCDLLDAVGLPTRLDLLFIDTSHTYEQTKRELEAWERRVKPGGLTLLHDAYEEGVRRAVAEYCDERGKRYSLRVGSFGMFVIWA
jgi:predicted O-methyltransferase YrrM